jgi:hypothetical protein
VKPSNPRYWKQMAEEEGLEVVSIVISKSVKMKVRAVDGRTMLIMASLSPSCHRAAENNRHFMRRFAKGKIN